MALSHVHVGSGLTESQTNFAIFTCDFKIIATLLLITVSHDCCLIDSESDFHFSTFSVNTNMEVNLACVKAFPWYFVPFSLFERAGIGTARVRKSEKLKNTCYAA